MRKLMMSAAVVAAFMAGCKSIEVDRRAQAIATDKNGEVVKMADGNPIVLDGGWSVDYFQHWNWQKFDNLAAKAGSAELQINNYASGADTNLTALVETSLNGAALLATKIGAAIVTAGGSTAAEGTGAAIGALVEKFITSGGDPAKATVDCKDGSCTVSDGAVTCTDGNCYAR